MAVVLAADGDMVVGLVAVDVAVFSGAAEAMATGSAEAGDMLVGSGAVGMEDLPAIME